MKFCDTCGNLLRVRIEGQDRFLYCRVCNKKTKLDEKITISTQQNEEKEDIIVVSEEEKNTFPVTEIMCPKCNEMREAEWAMQQTRGGDEPPTRFYQCKACGWRWREYS